MEHIHPNCGLILADATRIHQVVMNLGTNAFHAMQAAGGILDIILMPIKVDEELLRTNPRLKEGAYVQLTVRDTGHGMDAATMERIFDPFFTTKPVNQGTGMGLSVVHAIIENHGGVITVESEPGQGAAFTIYFPKIEEKRENNIPLLQIYSEGHEHILFVDDEDMLLQTGKQMLERLGYQVTTTNSSREALEKFRQSPDHFNLVITDQVMPQMTGLELAKELFRIRPTIPVLLMTGYSEMVSPETVQESGICQMSLKPTSSRQLGETIRKILNAEKNVQA
jgi:CheY-like chemotaxis protein